MKRWMVKQEAEQWRLAAVFQFGCSLGCMFMLEYMAGCTCSVHVMYLYLRFSRSVQLFGFTSILCICMYQL